MPDAMAPSREEWEWGLAVVWSRSFGMPLASGGGTAPVLAPVTGMFNGAAYPARLVQRLHAAGELAFPPDAPFEVPPPALVASLQRLESNAAAHFEPRADAFVVTSAVAAAAG